MMRSFKEGKVSKGDLTTQVATLFREVGEAHHEAFSEVDGADPDWPIWYADYMHKRLCTLLQASFTRSELVYLLVRAERELALEAPGAEWSRYYARFLVGRYVVGPR